jgi:hypothetical protein
MTVMTKTQQEFMTMSNIEVLADTQKLEELLEYARMMRQTDEYETFHTESHWRLLEGPQQRPEHRALSVLSLARHYQACEASKGLMDNDIQDAVDTIVTYAVGQFAVPYATHHIHLRQFEEYNAEERKAAAKLLLWLAHDVLFVSGDTGDAWVELITEYYKAEQE